MKPKQKKKNLQGRQPSVAKAKPSEGEAKKGRLFAAALFPAALAFLLYMNTFNHGYVLDDEAVVSQNKFVQQGFEGIPEILTTPYWFGFNGTTDGYRPMSLLTYCIEWQFFGNNASVYHVMNVIWFAATAMLLFFLLRKWFKNAGLVFPLLVSLFFVTHPVHTEVVANIKSRDEILSFFFSLASLFYLKDYISGSKRIKLFASLGCFFLALLSKENAVMILLIVPIMLKMFTDLNRKKVIVTTVLFAVAFIAYGLIRLAVQGGEFTFRGEIPISDNALVAAPGLMHRLATAIWLLGDYIRILVFPVPLVCDYSYGAVEIVSWLNWKPILSLIVVAGILAFAIARRKKSKPVAFGILFFFVTLSLVANIFFLGGATFAERFLYMPSLGYCMVITAATAALFKFDLFKNTNESLAARARSNPWYFLTLAIFMAGYSYLTIRRNPDWKDDLTLYGRDVAKSPSGIKLNYYYAATLIEAAKDPNIIPPASKDSVLKLAASHLSRALALYPEYIDANHEMGNAYFYRGEYRKSLEYYDRSVSERSSNATHYSNYACALIEIGDYAKADELLQMAIRLNPNYSEAYGNLGAIYARQGKDPQALEMYLKAYRLNPEQFLLLRNMGSAYGNLKEYDNALFYFNKAYKINPNDAALNSYLALTYQFMGDAANAKYYSDQAAALGAGNR